ncbi:aspartate kinase [bacterium]|nr:aspartate kinase [bacterium]
MVVMKFGGASLRSPDALKQISKIIKKRISDQPIIVLSAVKGVTDLLIQSTAEALSDEVSIAANLNKLIAIHKSLVAESIESPSIRMETQKAVDYLLSRLERLLYGIAYTGECTPRTRDLILTFGERMAAHLLTGRLKAILCPAEALYADKIGIMAHGPWGMGSADISQTRKLLPENLKPLLAKGVVPVITGFFGSTAQNQSILFGRGGTDYSAAVVADAMKAKQLECWKDVDGFLSASPQITSNGRLLEYLSYEEAAELAYFGAKILHPRMVEPLMEQHIPLLIKNTFKTECSGTVIGPDSETHEQVIKSVTMDPNVVVLRIYGASVGYQVGLLKKLVSALSDTKINIKSVITSQTCINLLVDSKDAATGVSQLNALNLGFIDSIDLVDNIALIAVVGEGLLDTLGLAARVFRTVAEAGTNVEMISHGASNVAFYFIVKQADAEKTVKAIHHDFFEAPGGTLEK